MQNLASELKQMSNPLREPTAESMDGGMSLESDPFIPSVLGATNFGTDIGSLFYNIQFCHFLPSAHLTLTSHHLKEPPGSFGGRLTFVPGTLNEPTGDPFDVVVAPFALDTPEYTF